MGTDDTRVVKETHLEAVSNNVDEELVNEVEVVTMDESEQVPSENIPLPTIEVLGEGAVSSSVATSTPWDCQSQLELLVREVNALKQRLANLMQSVQERLMLEETLARHSAAPEPAPLVIANSPPVLSRNTQPTLTNSAVKRESTKSKYAKKRRTMIPGGITRMPRSLNGKPGITTVGQLNLSTALSDNDEDFD